MRRDRERNEYTQLGKRLSSQKIFTFFVIYHFFLSYFIIVANGSKQNFNKVIPISIKQMSTQYSLLKQLLYILYMEMGNGFMYVCCDADRQTSTITIQQ